MQVQQLQVNFKEGNKVLTDFIENIDEVIKNYSSYDDESRHKIDVIMYVTDPREISTIETLKENLSILTGIKNLSVLSSNSTVELVKYLIANTTREDIHRLIQLRIALNSVQAAVKNNPSSNIDELFDKSLDEAKKIYG